MSKQDWRELQTYRALGKPDELGKVVKCKNCIHAIRLPAQIDISPALWEETWLCLCLARIVEENFYCDSGERRTNDG